MRVAACLLFVALACASGGARADARPAWAAEARSAVIPVREASGEVAQMVTTWFVPPGKGPFPVVLFSHGRPAGASDRDRLELGVSRSQLKWARARRWCRRCDRAMATAPAATSS